MTNWKSATITDAMRQNVEAEFVDRRLILAGEFKAELEHVSKLHAVVDAKLGLIATVEAAEEVLKEAKASAAKLLANASIAISAKNVEADELIAMTNDAAERARKKMNMAIDFETSLNKRAVKLEEQKRAYEAGMKEVKDSIALAKAMAKEAMDNEAALTVKITAYTAAAATLAMREKAFNAKLDALKIAD